MFGIFEGLGTPTHTKVVGFLNASKIPDLFVASGCPCWDDGTTQPYTFGWQPNYTIEGKILGQYIKQHFPGKKIGVLYQDDDFGKGGLAGIKDEVPGLVDRVEGALSAWRDHARPADHRDQVLRRADPGRLHRADLHRDRSADLVHARLQAAARRLERRHRPDHGGWPAQDDLQGQGVGHRADRRRDHRRLPALAHGHHEPVDPAVHEDPRPSTTRARRSTATSSTGWPTPTRWSRRSRPPART